MKLASVVLALLSWPQAVLAGPAPAGVAGGTVILSEEGFWRFHVAMRRPLLLDGNAGAAKGGSPAVLPIAVPYRSYPGIESMETPAPPAGWAAADFDDADWPRAVAAEKRSGSVAAVAFAPGVGHCTGLLCLRGKFQVTDPAAVTKLELAMAYRGGAAVYLNGRQVARGHLPEGPLEANTPAAPHPADAFLDAEGEPIPGPYHAEKRIKAGEADLGRRIALRDRGLGPIAIQAGLLRKGVNVLAVELHRSDYHPSARLWFRNPHLGRETGWFPIGLRELRLSASGGGAVANTSRPSGVQVWRQDIHDRVSVLDYGDPCEELGPMRLVAPRGGIAGGRMVIGSTEPLRGLSAAAGALAPQAGGPAIPASGIQVRYERLDGHAYQQPDWFDGLMPAPPEEVTMHKSGRAIQPVWVTVRVPRDAAPGEYRGSLTLSAGGKQLQAVPIHLRVAGWAVPDPRDYRTYVGVYQSPTSLALQYRVPEWSDRHWRLMDKSFELLGQVGNRVLIVPIANRTQFGNDEGMVYWVRKGDGTFEHDFTVLDRFLALAKKHLGRPDFVSLQVWHAGGWEARKADQENAVTVLDRKTGWREAMQVPPFGTEESKRFWRPVLEGVHQRLAALGWERAMCLGILSDGTAPPEVLKAFDEITPGGARWHRGCHSVTRDAAPYALRGGGVVAFHEYCYGMEMADPAKGLPAISDQRGRPGVAFIRHSFDDRLSLLKFRNMAERALYCRTRGVGRIGLDFWDVLDAGTNKAHNIYNRWPYSSCAQREPNLFRMTWPGPDGAEPTVRFEMFREGIQEAEAMIVVAEALQKHADAIGPQLAAECRRLLADRIRYCLRTASEGNDVRFRTYHRGWRDLTARLYDLAGKVTAKMTAEAQRRLAPATQPETFSQERESCGVGVQRPQSS